MFLHAGWMHLLGNMLFLWIFGDNVELHIGRVAYLAIYVLTGVLATALFSLFVLDSTLPMIGASGAISGVLGCYFLWFPRNRVRVLVFLFLFVNIIRLPARWVLGFYLVVQNLIPFLFQRADSGVAYGAHIGGFLGGLGVAAVANRVSRWRALRGAVPAGDRWATIGRARVARDAASAFGAMISSGDYPQALRLYSEMPAHERRDLEEDDVLRLSDWLAARGQYDAGLALLQRFIATHPMSSALPRAHLRAGLIHLHEERLPSAYQHFLTVLDLEPSAQELSGAQAGLAEVQRREASRHRLGFH